MLHFLLGMAIKVKELEMFDIENDVNEIEKNETAQANGSMQDEFQHVSCLESDVKLEATIRELEATKEKFSRLTADFHNAQKRAESDRLLQIDRIRCDVLQSLLPIVDNFDRALEAAAKQSQENAMPTAELVGFQMIHKMLYDFLTTQKVTVINQVTVFDPAVHEAVMQVTQGADDIPSGHIVTVFEKGFMYKDIILRTAKVSVKM